MKEYRIFIKIPLDFIVLRVNKKYIIIGIGDGLIQTKRQPIASASYIQINASLGKMYQL